MKGRRTNSLHKQNSLIKEVGKLAHHSSLESFFRCSDLKKKKSSFGECIGSRGLAYETTWDPYSKLR